MANIFHVPGRNPRKGQILVLSTLSLSMVFATIGLTVDLGWGYFKKQQAQSAADSAAQAATIDALTRGFTCAANGVVCGTYTCANPNVSPATTNLQAGCLYAGTNGFRNTGDQTVTLTADVGTSSLPSGVSGSVPVYWVKATITDKTHNLFLYLSGFQNAAIAAEATAAVVVSPGGNCVLALSPNAPDALKVNGNVTVTSACGVYVNSSNASTAIDVKGGAVVSGTQVQEVGGYTLGNNATISPAPTTVGTIADPLSTLIPPSYSGCDYTNYQASGAGSTTLNVKAK